MPEWRTLPEAPEYLVSEDGFVYNEKTSHNVTPFQVTGGKLAVTLTTDRQRYTRGLASVVARAFLTPYREEYTTVLHLDGDNWNNAVANLVWTTRSYANRYLRMLTRGPTDAHKLGPITNVHTQEQYPDIWTAATSEGVLADDILNGLIRERPVSINGCMYVKL